MIACAWSDVLSQTVKECITPILNQVNAHMDGRYSIHRKYINLEQFLIALLGIVFLFFAISCFHSIQNKKSFSRWMDHLSIDERKDLGIFFHNLFATEDFGYTLFGD